MNQHVNRQVLAVGAAACRSQVTAALERRGYDILLAESSEEAVHALARWKVICVLADAALAGAGPTDAGLAGTATGGLIADLIQGESEAAIVLLSEYPSLVAATAALRAGAMDYLRADTRPEDIVVAVETAIDRQASRARERAVEQSLRAEVAALTIELAPVGAVELQAELADRIADFRMCRGVGVFHGAGT